VFEYVCDRIIPGCTYTDRDESREKLMERVGTHLAQKHGKDRHDDRIASALERTGITFVRPA
jgi:predicted small metal-binding protein